MPLSGFYSFFYTPALTQHIITASRQLFPGHLPPDKFHAMELVFLGSCPPWNLSGRKLYGLQLVCSVTETYSPTLRAHRSLSTDIYSPNVGSLYPIQMNLGSFLEPPPPSTCPFWNLSGGNSSFQELVHPGTCLPRNMST